MAICSFLLPLVSLFFVAYGETGNYCSGVYLNEDSCIANGCFWCYDESSPSGCYSEFSAALISGPTIFCKSFDILKSEEDEQIYENENSWLETTMHRKGRKSFGVNSKQFEYDDDNSSRRLEENIDKIHPKICDPDVEQIAGYFHDNNKDKHIFYWLFESRSDPENDPVILWLTGGPGCSSVLALFVENGPCKVNAEDGSTELNPYSWNNNATLIFVDQPVGTGFSYGVHNKDEIGVSNDMYSFLKTFLIQFPKYRKQDFYIFGESYAGHYIPAISHRIWFNQKNLSKEQRVINLQGIAIGNGLTDVETQVSYYADMAYKSGTAPSRVSSRVYHFMKNISTPIAVFSAKLCARSSLPGLCAIGETIVDSLLLEPYTATGYNVYDMRIKCEIPGLCYNFSHIDRYLNDVDVQKVLGVNKKWEACNAAVNLEFANDWMHSFEDQIPDLLKSQIEVLIYAGDQDYICNWLGNRAWVANLSWPGKSEWNAAPVRPFVVGGSSAGLYQSYNGLTFMQVFQAGHMVPMDQPEVAFHMVLRFTKS